MAKKQDESGATVYTRFERARIIGARALQIGYGAPILVKLNGPEESLDPIGVSEREFAEGVIPVTVLRQQAQ